jgi:hypothetical protein
MMKVYASRLLILAALAMFALTPTAGASSVALTPGVVASSSVLDGCSDSQPECEDCCEHAECCCLQSGGQVAGSTCSYQDDACTLPGCQGGSQSCETCDPI